MAKFKVGDRVRIIFSYGWPELSGQEGRIIEVATDKGVEGISEWRVAPDSWGSYMAPYKGINGAAKFAPNSSQLEPILYDGAQPSEFSYSELMDNLRTKVQEEV